MENKNYLAQIPKDLGEKWIAALESGEYKQAKKMLYNKIENSYCCLGVLGCILGTPKESMNGVSSRIIEDYIDGLPNNLNYYNNQNSIIKITEKNDENNSNFLEMAKFIKKNIQFI